MTAPRVKIEWYCLLSVARLFFFLFNSYFFPHSDVNKDRLVKARLVDQGEGQLKSEESAPGWGEKDLDWPKIIKEVPRWILGHLFSEEKAFDTS